MSVVDEVITEPQQASEFLYALLDQQKETLGIGFLGLDERLKPEYPAVMVLSGGKEKQLHGTHIFRVMLEVFLMVYHARLDSTHTHRTKEDLELVTNIENLIESGKMNFDDKIVFAYVQQTAPITGTGRMNDSVVGTQMLVSIETRKGFPYGP
jgi:hypothetical protein